tara:strand:+ start:58 stop:273 length:216 start_codon:yes stop_codon:yes gene_type:complete
MLEHDGPPYNLELKKDVLRNIENLKRTQIRGGKNDKNNGCMVRNFKMIYEQDCRNKVKTEFRDNGLKTNIK